MNSKIGRLVLGFGAVGLMLAGAAFADGHRDGGHFEGGHGGGGGREAAPAHFAGPAHYAAPAARFQAPARAQIQPHYQGGSRYAQPAYRGFAPQERVAPVQHFANADHGHWGGDRGWRGGDGDRHWGVGDHRWGDGDHDRYWAGTYWGGGYWGGGYWPQVFYGVDFAWFLPTLPGVYSTYWYDGIPYYYANDAYYIWDPGYDGYVATDPPPVASAADAQPASPNDGGAQIFMYPKNGQSAEQQREDRIACERWAADQVGNAGTNSADYRRAMTACAEGRGYSVR